MPFDPFARDPNHLRISAQDAELLARDPLPLRIIVPVSIESGGEPMSEKTPTPLEEALALHARLTSKISGYDDNSCRGINSPAPYDTWCSVEGFDEMKDALGLILAIHVPHPSRIGDVVLCRSCPTQGYPCLTVKAVCEATYTTL